MMHCSSSIHEFALLGHSVRHTYSKEDSICKPQLSQRTMQIVHTKSQRMESSIAIASLPNSTYYLWEYTLPCAYLPSFSTLDLSYTFVRLLFPIVRVRPLGFEGVLQYTLLNSLVHSLRYIYS
jgi:hypothetical protein